MLISADLDSTINTQHFFRNVMRAFSRPCQAHSMRDGAAGQALPQAKDATLKELCNIFLDSSVSFYVHGDPELAGAIREATYAKTADIEAADFVLLDGARDYALLDRVYPGSLVSPHKGATVFAAVPQIDGAVKIEAEGPGINGRASCLVDASIARCLRQVAAMDKEYPKGFELLFATPQGDLFAVPRHVRTYEEEEF